MCVCVLCICVHLCDVCRNYYCTAVISLRIDIRCDSYQLVLVFLFFFLCFASLLPLYPHHYMQSVKRIVFMAEDAPYTSPLLLVHCYIGNERW